MTTTLNLTGPIVGNDSSWIYDYLGIDCISPKNVMESIGDASEQLVINLSSGGGEVTAASEIYTALRQMNTTVSINITGMAASAASIIAMAGDTVNISPTAQMMIHQASLRDVSGNKDDLTHLSNILDKTDQSIVQAYVDRTGLPVDKIVKMMADETFLTAQEAVEYGFADQIMFTGTGTQNKVTNSLETGMFPDDVINKIGTLISVKEQVKNEKAQEVPDTNTTESRQAQRSAKAAILLEELN
ncbi:head maturation protease, ClpP-related [Weissella viridescens]|uniref:ATP-dependent Clp protease proteolytic subunit n=1 Tax=Weissella viridescens TaxID=1629 RepID=A0A0R2GZY0_WEIVI|nr:head maturation protease, ClpP-related [Weissella viridescens]KRN46208.1 phage Clp-protease [Weissella viridescens]